MTDDTTTMDGDAVAIASAVGAIAAPVAADLALDVVDIVVKGPKGRRIVRIVVDGEDGLGVDVDDMATLSRGVSDLLDEQDEIVDGAYTLEVSSPGVDRPLTQPHHWVRHVGKYVEVVHLDPKADKGQTKQTTGKLAEADDQQVVVNVKGRMVKIALDDVESAKAVLPW